MSKRADRVEHPAAAAASRRSVPRGEDRAGPSGGVLALQRAAGNRAVCELLADVAVAQRQEVPAPTGPLSAAAAARAVQFYNVRSGYSAQIIEQIQQAVGAVPAGIADADTVQAVARWQGAQTGTPVLEVDGMAGPRTLPRLFGHGLNAAGEGAAFGEAAQTQVIDHWSELSVQERATRLVTAVNQRLAAAGVPAVTPNPSDTGVDAGSFDFPTWNMNIGNRALARTSLTRDQAADIADTIYHEARHAEQWFRMAQYRAGQHRAAGQIATEMSIPQRIAQAAVADPLPAGSMQALIARGWFDNVYGAGAQARDATLTAVERAAQRRDAARRRAKSHPTPANQAAAAAAEAAFRRSFAAYQHLPEENDAWATGPQAAAAVTAGSPAPLISGPDSEDVPSTLDSLPGQLRDLLPGTEEVLV